MILNNFQIDDIIKTAFAEDINYIDITSDLIFDENAESTAEFITKNDGVICGLFVAARVFELIDPACETEILARDGRETKKGDILMRIRGKTRALMKAERTALNFLCHMSGIATAANRLVSKCTGTNASVADTRKTIPGLRVLQKYAVTVGGGKNHRFNLSDAVMIKDNHIDACGGITAAVQKIRQKTGHTVKIEVETRNLSEITEALEAGADIILLDNMSLNEMTEAVKLIGRRAVTEASGNITEENVADIAKTGVDVISVGALTHSVKAFDVSMRMV